MDTMIRIRSILLALVIVSALSLANEQPVADGGFRILSWNISNDAFENEAEEFLSILRWADPDVVLLDEVSPHSDPEKLRAALEALRPGNKESWNISVGVSGGRQRDVIASRAPQETLPEFSSIVAYPDADRQYVLENMSQEERLNPGLSMDYGIPVNAAILVIGGKRLLVVITDLQCCGDSPESWQEYRRQVEAREIRHRIEQVLERTEIDSLVIAGDFNLVNGNAAATLLKRPYTICSEDLSAAKLFHPDNDNNWTWDGRNTPFPNGILDFQFYCTQSLEMRSGLILDTEALAPQMLEKHGLDRDTVKRTGRHRPLLAEYRWH
jgi:endonuclease/exonuclease/phosphatase family metal-dependent hydrolase